MEKLEIKKYFQYCAKPAAHLVFLCALMIVIFLNSTAVRADDSTSYHRFVERLVNEGKIDFSIPGFHGADFPTAIIYALTRSEYSVHYNDIFFAIANVIMIYFAVTAIFKNQLESQSLKTAGIFASYLYVLGASEYTNALRGGHHTPLIFFALLGLNLLFRGSRWAWLPMGFSYIIRPFPVVFFPFFLYKRKLSQFFLSLIIPALYVFAQYVQRGEVMIGVHTTWTLQTLFSLKRFFLNIGYAFQNYFSFHGYSFINPLTVGDFAHVPPFITFLALAGVLWHKRYFQDRWFFTALVASSALGLFLPASFYHLDTWYLWSFNFTLMLLCLPVLLRAIKILPLVAASFGYHILYVFLAARGVYWSQKNFTLFLVFGIIFLISIFYTAINYKKDENIFRV